jgi:hypothetical protein
LRASTVLLDCTCYPPVGKNGQIEVCAVSCLSPRAARGYPKNRRDRSAIACRTAQGDTCRSHAPPCCVREAAQQGRQQPRERSKVRCFCIESSQTHTTVWTRPFVFLCGSVRWERNTRAHAMQPALHILNPSGFVPTFLPHTC